jgi:hypothetical protein
LGYQKGLKQKDGLCMSCMVMGWINEFGEHHFGN